MLNDLPDRRTFLASAALLLPALAALEVGCRCQVEPEPTEPPANDEDDAAPELNDEHAGYAPLPNAEPVVRVRIARTRTAGEKISVGADGAWILFEPLPSADDPPHTPGGRAAAMSVLKGPAQIMIDSGSWFVRDAVGFRAAIEPGRSFDVMAVDRGAGSTIAIDGVAHPGLLRFVARPQWGDAAFDVINHVSVERYLPGVLSKELFAHWNEETFAAQAIAARSFACAESAHFLKRRDYDMTNTASSQAYVGEATNERSRRAARRTHGVVLSYGGALVPGYYSSCCGGRAASAEDAIGVHPFNRIPPLLGRDGEDVCTAAPLYRWTIQRPMADVTLRMNRWAVKNGPEALRTIREIASAEITEVGSHGRPLAFTVRAAGDAEAANSGVVLSADALRRAVDYAGAPHPAPKTPLWSSDVRVEIDNRNVRFHGRGYGHGAGLCQYGAQALAERGEGYEAILAWYYPQVELVRVYE